MFDDIDRLLSALRHRDDLVAWLAARRFDCRTSRQHFSHRAVTIRALEGAPIPNSDRFIAIERLSICSCPR